MAKEKVRLDVLLKEKGLVPSRARARALIMAGSVLVDGNAVTKSGFAVCPSQQLEVKADACPFVSRGGLKLQKALDHFGISLKSRVCMDVGASTGGFTQCLLKYGARLVYAVDVGYGQLDWHLRNRPDIVNLERTNIRYVTRDIFGEVPGFASVDTSFISLKLVIPKVAELITGRGEIIALIKPQFEAGRKRVGKGGIVRDPSVHDDVLADLRQFFSRQLGLEIRGMVPSPVLGARGNREFLVYLKKNL